MGEFLSVDGVGMNYQEENGETKAIDNISFSVMESEFVSIIGPSGCGKSTMLSILSGLIKPSSGHVTINGVSDAQSENDRISIGYMLQKDHLFEWRTILSNALLGLEIQKKLNPETKAYTVSLLNKYGLGDFMDNRPSQLSGGMRQRAALIRTLAVKPDLLLLDEPFSALDYQTRLYVADEIGSIIRDEKKTALMVTHDISEAISLSDRVIVLSKRPSTIRSIHHIKLSLTERTAMKSREAPEFKDYFNTIWKELDVHV